MNTTPPRKAALSHQRAYDLLRDALRDGRLPAGMSIRHVRGRESRTSHEYSVADGFSEERYPSLQAIVIEYNLTEGA